MYPFLFTVVSILLIFSGVKTGFVAPKEDNFLRPTIIEKSTTSSEVNLNALDKKENRCEKNPKFCEPSLIPHLPTPTIGHEPKPTEIIQEPTIYLLQPTKELLPSVPVPTEQPITPTIDPVEPSLPYPCDITPGPIVPKNRMLPQVIPC